MEGGIPLFTLRVMFGVALIALLATDALAASRVSVHSNFFAPGVRTVARGDTVRWVNESGTLHTITAYGGRWSKDVLLNGSGGVTRSTFRRRGVYKYRCRFHSELRSGVCSGMCGKIIVLRRPPSSRSPL